MKQESAALTQFFAPVRLGPFALNCACRAVSIAVLVFSSNISAQLKLSDFKFAVPFEQTNSPDVRSRPKSLLSAGEAQAVTNDLYRGQTVRIENYQLDGKTNLIIRTPECLFDAEKNIALSTNRLELESPNGLYIAGIGFICYLTNFNLIISNDVRTLVQQRLLQSAPEVPGIGLRTNRVQGTNIGMTVTSRFAELNYASNVLIYSGEVRVDHAQLTLECARLTIYRNTNGTLERVLAEQDVRIVNKLDRSEARGDLAVYSLMPVETINLSGHAQWNDDLRKSRADRFAFNLKQKHLRAEGHAWMSLPRQGIAQPQLGLMKTMKTNADARVEITADLLDLQMATTNQPHRSLRAEHNVVIVSPADESRATASKAVFDERTGIAELTGDAVWQAADRMARGQLLRYDRTNHIFLAQQNAYLKVPVSALGSTHTNASTLAKRPESTNTPAPQFVEVYSSDYTYTSNSLVFRDDVRGRLLEGDALRGKIQCAFLALRFTNQLESAFASGKIKLEQLPWPTASGRKIARTLHCEQLQVRMQSGGIAERIAADTNVLAEQHEWRTPTNAPVRSLFTADHVIADFFPRTNQVKEAVADGHVSMFQEGRMANGDRALYHGATDTVELLGNPTADFPEAKITDADVLIWDRTRNKIAGRKLKGEGELHSSRSNRPPAQLLPPR